MGNVNQDDAHSLRCYYDYILKDLRDALYNCKCYERRLADLKCRDFATVLASGSGSALAFAKFADFNILYWPYFVATVGAIGAVLSFMKVSDQLSTKIADTAKMRSEHSTLFHTLENLIQEVRADRFITAEQLAAYRELRQRSIELGAKDEFKPRSKVEKEVQAEVIKLTAQWNERPAFIVRQVATDQPLQSVLPARPAVLEIAALSDGARDANNGDK